MNGRINQSPTSDEGEQRRRRRNASWNASQIFREPQQSLQINFSLFIARFVDDDTREETQTLGRDDDDDDSRIMQAENLCRFMSPYGNEVHKGTKNAIITIPRCAIFDFYAAGEKCFQTHFYANLFTFRVLLSGKHKNSKLGNAAASKHKQLSRSLNNRLESMMQTDAFN